MASAICSRTMKANQLLAIICTMVFAMMGAAVAGEVTYRATMTGVT